MKIPLSSAKRNAINNFFCFYQSDEQFSPTAVKTQVTEALRRIEKSPERDEVTKAISTDACRLRDGDPDVGVL